jgi:hypothetical protein
MADIGFECVVTHHFAGGGMGGGMQQAPPQPKDINIEQARTVLKAIIGVVKTEESGQRIQMAMQQLQQQMQQAPPDMKPEQAAQARMAAIMPVLTQLTASVTSQFQFEGGFMQAVMSIQKAATEAKDSEVMQALMPLKELVTGENPARTKGRIPEMDKIVLDFAAKDEASQKAAIAEVEAAIEKGAKPLAKFYLKTMTRIVEKGIDAAEKEGERARF